MSLDNVFTGFAAVDTVSATYAVDGSDAGKLIVIDTDGADIALPDDGAYDSPSDPLTEGATVTPSAGTAFLPIGTIIGVIATPTLSTGCDITAPGDATVTGTTALVQNQLALCVKIAANTWIVLTA